MKRNPAGIRLSALKEILLPVLVFIFGLQMIRGFFASLTWYVMFTVGVGAFDLIPYAFGTFFLGLLAAVLRRLAGSRGSLWITGGGAALLRLSEQISRDPALDLWLTIAGIGLFLNFIPLFILWVRETAQNASWRWTYGLILGLSADAALKGIFGPRDLSTITGLYPVLIIALLAAGVFWALWQEPKPDPESTGSSKGEFSAGLMAIGLVLILQLLYFQSSGWVEQLSGIPFPLGFLIVQAGYLAAASGLGFGYAKPQIFHPALAAAAGLALAITTFSIYSFGAVSLIALLLAQFYLGWGLAGIGISSQAKKSSRFWISTLAVNGGMLLFLALGFVFYLSLDIALPFPKEIIPAIAAAILMILYTVSAVKIRFKPDQAWDYTGLLAAGTLLIIPLLSWIAWSPGPKPVEGDGFPVSVMTYNIRSGYHQNGFQDLEGIARVIEESGADIIGLQEVSRVRLMDSGADIPTWLSRRLGMPYLFQATEESIWGNALLSRYPVVDSGSVDLPREGAPIGRGFLWAEIDVGVGEPLLVIVTHLHQVVEEPEIREAQIPVILNFWNDQTQTVIMGDFNAEPDAEELAVIYTAGMVDTWLESGQGPGYTVDANNPTKRIDFIWASPDLESTEIEVLQTLSSDHLPVLGLIRSKE